MNFLQKLHELLGLIKGVKVALPDPNAVEKGSVAASQLAALTNAQANMETLAADFKATVEAFEADRQKGLTAEQKQSIIDEAINSGDLLRKSDHDAALDIAVQNKATELQTAFNEKIAAAERAAAARRELAAEIPQAEVLSALPDSVLGAADFATAGKPKILARFAELKKSGVNALGVLKEVAGLGVTDEDENTFRSRHEGWRELASASRGGGAVPPIQPGGGGNPAAPKVMPLC